MYWKVSPNVAGSHLMMKAVALTISVAWLYVIYCSPVEEVPCDDCCTYSNYSNWKASNFRPVPSRQCASGFVVVEKRMRTVLAGGCDDQMDERTAECKQLAVPNASHIYQKDSFSAYLFPD